jgi:hypothetical protein
VSQDDPKRASEDPHELAALSTLDELQRLNAAEDLLEKRWQRRRRTARIFSVSQAMVGYVALLGFFANAYQNYNSKKQAEARAELDEARWAKEFKRAQDADKYRAFFETSALATDPRNADKRLVGYALLKEFVDDKDYNAKATFMLEESLALELRDEHEPGLDEPHRAAVVAILSALSHTSDCKALTRAAHSIDKLALRHAQRQDVDEASEVLGLYVLRVVGRATQVCQPKDLLDARKPIRDFLSRQPALADLTGKPAPVDIDRRIVEILKKRVAEEAEGGVSTSSDVLAALDKACKTIQHDKLTDGIGLCTPAPPAAPPPPPKH